MTNVVGLVGSLRAESLNRKLMQAARQLAPADLHIELFDRLREIPPYDEDAKQRGFPEPVVELRSALQGADGLLIVSPEYNYSIPGFLKNAIDWASRPPDQPFDGKAVSIMGASPSAVGTARMQYDLRRCFVYLNAHVVEQPEVLVGQATEAFDDDGNLVSEDSRKFVERQLEALQQLIRTLN